MDNNIKKFYYSKEYYNETLCRPMPFTVLKDRELITAYINGYDKQIINILKNLGEVPLPVKKRIMREVLDNIDLKGYMYCLAK